MQYLLWNFFMFNKTAIRYTCRIHWHIHCRIGLCSFVKKCYWTGCRVWNTAHYFPDTHTHTHTLTHSLTLTLILTHTHTHMLTYTCTHTHTVLYWSSMIGFTSHSFSLCHRPMFPISGTQQIRASPLHRDGWEIWQPASWFLCFSIWSSKEILIAHL